MKKIIAIALFVASFNASAYGPYNQAYTFNQQYGSTNWYSSPLGQGVAVAGVTLIGGLVNAMNRPDPVVVQQQQQPVYVNQNGGQPVYRQGYGYGQQGSTGTGCHMQQVYDQSGQSQTVKVCQ